MTQILLPNNNVIYINDEVQISPSGKEFRLSGLKVADKPEKFINGSYKRHWIYIFKYINGGFFEIEIDYYDKFVMLNKC